MQGYNNSGNFALFGLFRRCLGRVHFAFSLFALLHLYFRIYFDSRRFCNGRRRLGLGIDDHGVRFSSRGIYRTVRNVSVLEDLLGVREARGILPHGGRGMCGPYGLGSYDEMPCYWLGFWANRDENEK